MADLYRRESQSLEGHINAMERLIEALLSYACLHVQHMSKGLRFGNFKSNRRLSRGMEFDSTGTWRFGDQFSDIDMRHLPPSMIRHSILYSLCNGEMRKIQSLPTMESHSIFVLDLSSSMLGGYMLGVSGALEPEVWEKTKLGALCYALVIFLHFAYQAGFRLKMIYIDNGKATVETVALGGNSIHMILNRVKEIILSTYRNLLKNENYTEEFAMSAALLSALKTSRAYSVVFLLSDYLEKFELYEHNLRLLLQRHCVMLIDVAHKEDRSVDVPGRLNFHAPRFPVREGARHLEKGTHEVPITRQSAINWNSFQKGNLENVKKLALRHDRILESFGGLSIQQSYAKALRVFLKIK